MIKPGQAEYAEAVIKLILPEVFSQIQEILNDNQQNKILEKCYDEVFLRFEMSKEI